MRYIPHTPEDVRRMLAAIGAASVDELFSSIPQPLRLTGELELPAPLSECELLEHLRQLGTKNMPQSRASGHLCFAGAGLYRHYIPTAVAALASRSEFYTAYTPYQPELSQGTLMAIFEFQTLIAELTGMEVANASMYDGASATAEAVMMAQRLTKRPRALLARSLHPEYARTCATYLAGLREQGAALGELPFTEAGALDLGALEQALDSTVAGVVVQSPNFLGLLEDLAPIAELCHRAGALLIAVCTEPLALALMQPPGELGADVAVGEAIGLAGPLSMGGPGLGFFAVKDKKAVRAMPGRLVGQTEDSAGLPGFVLTLSTREQHIRRERATSNICTNHGLMALRFTIHLALLGKTGFEQLARLNMARAALAREMICGMDGFTPAFAGPCFNELALRVPSRDAATVLAQAASRGVVAGVALGRFYPELKDVILLAASETHTPEDLKRLTHSLKISG